MTAINIAIIGECMIEMSGQPFKELNQSFGGDTMNTAIYLKQLLSNKVNTYFVSSVGCDAFSEAMLDKWHEYKINTEYVLKNSEKHCGLYHIQNDESGERQFTYWRSDSAAKYLMQHHKIDEIFLKLSNFGSIFLSGISLAILPHQDRLDLLGKLQSLKEKGTKIIFDGNYRPKLWNDIAECQLIYSKIYQLADLALVTFEDEQLLWKDSNIKNCYQRLLTHNINELVIKDGANGCHYYSDKTYVYTPSNEVAQVIDTTAAGDSFNAGYLAAWLFYKSPKQAAELGHKVASQVIQQKGAIVPINISL